MTSSSKEPFYNKPKTLTIQDRHYWDSFRKGIDYLLTFDYFGIIKAENAFRDLLNGEREKNILPESQCKFYIMLNIVVEIFKNNFVRGTLP